MRKKDGNSVYRNCLANLHPRNGGWTILYDVTIAASCVFLSVQDQEGLEPVLFFSGN